MSDKPRHGLIIRYRFETVAGVEHPPADDHNCIFLSHDHHDRIECLKCKRVAREVKTGDGPWMPVGQHRQIVSREIDIINRFIGKDDDVRV